MRILILGTSLRGLQDAARISLADGAEVVMYDAVSPEPPTDLRGRVTVLPPEWRPDFLMGIERVITSPWFAAVRPPVSDAIAAGIDVITEAGFGLEHMDIPFAAITGTNGKTTVTEVVTDMLRASGVRAEGGGNLGTPVSALTHTDADILVLELSSYQLRFLGGAVPSAAALLNIAPDHLDWHGRFEEYVDAKARIFAGMDHGSVLAYNADDPVVVSVVSKAECRLIPCSGTIVPSNGNGVEGNRIFVDGEEFAAPTDDPSFLSISSRLERSLLPSERHAQACSVRSRHSGRATTGDKSSRRTTASSGSMTRRRRTLMRHRPRSGHSLRSCCLPVARTRVSIFRRSGTSKESRT